MNCHKCGNPLRIVSGGQKSALDSTDIIMVHVWGCLNKDCTEAMKEQNRTENKVESFNG